MIWFWIFMMSMDLLVPIVMIGYGSYFIKRAPKSINHLCGYRTSRSMKNRQTWEFAHHYFGKLSCMIGWILVPVSVIPMLFVFGKDDDTVGIVGGIVCMIQVIALIITIIPTEQALKKTFDENGDIK